MNGLKTLLALSLAGALGLFYWFYEIQGESLRESAKLDLKRIFAFAQKEPLAELQWQSPETGLVRLEAKQGTWSLLSPFKSAVDEAQLIALLDQVKALTLDEILDEAPTDYAAFGLSPSARIFTVRSASGSAKTLFLGKENPTGQLSYARIDGQSAVLLLGSYYKGSLFKTGKDLKIKPTPRPAPTARPTATTVK